MKKTKSLGMHFRYCVQFWKRAKGLRYLLLRRVQQSERVRVLAKIPYTRNTNFGELSRTLALLNSPQVVKTVLINPSESLFTFVNHPQKPMVSLACAYWSLAIMLIFSSSVNKSCPIPIGYFTLSWRKPH